MRLRYARWPFLCFVLACSLIGQMRASETPGVVVRAQIDPAVKPVPAAIRVRVADEDANEVTIECPVDRGIMRCEVPVGILDLTVYVPGFAPAYFEHVDPARTHDLGTLSLKPGGRISGKLTAGTSPVAGLAVQATPSPDSSGRPPGVLRTLTVRTRRGGDFEFRDVPAGLYTVATAPDGFTPASRTNVRVIASGVASLGAIPLRALGSLDVVITPPVDEAQQPWSVRIIRAVEGSPYVEPVRSGAATSSGVWRAQLLDNGRYRVEVYSSRHDRAAAEDVEVGGRPSTVAITIERLTLEGRLRLDDGVIASAVTLIWPDGTRNTFQPAKDGSFGGVVRHTGTCRAAVALSKPKAEIQVPAVNVERSGSCCARAELALPEGRITGAVTDEAGAGVHASVLLTSAAGIEATTETQADGTFELVGLKEGPRQVQAFAPAGESDMVAVSVDETSASEANLTIRSVAAVTGRISTSDGVGVPTAAIRYAPVGAALRQAVSDLDGKFQIKVPRGQIIRFVVVGPGIPAYFGTYRVGEEPQQSLPIIVSSRSGKLVLKVGAAPPWPFVTPDGVFFPALFQLFVPRVGAPPAEYGQDGFVVELPPGTYSVCPQPQVSVRCASKVVPFGGEVIAQESEGAWR